VWRRQTLGRSTPPPLPARGAFDLDEALSAELDRVGVSLNRADFGDAVVAGALGDLVWIMGAVAVTGGDRAWEGSEQRAFALLADLPDNAGADAFWEAFSCR
jgi:hypothetical protein